MKNLIVVFTLGSCIAFTKFSLFVKSALYAFQADILVYILKKILGLKKLKNLRNTRKSVENPTFSLLI